MLLNSESETGGGRFALSALDSKSHFTEDPVLGYGTYIYFSRIYFRSKFEMFDLAYLCHFYGHIYELT